MIKSMLVCMTLAIAGVADAKAPPAEYDVPGAIAAADAARPATGARGRFTMMVVATGQVGGATFLNSSEDYRAPDDLSLRLSPNVVKALTRQYGVAPKDWFKGKQMVVDGTVRRVKIVDTINAHPVGFNRWQHVVRVTLPSQIVSAE